MPTYDYICSQCQHEFEAFQRMSEDPLKDCPACAEPALRRKIGLGAGIIFKGGGFYETDFKDRKGYKGSDSKPAAGDSQPASGEAAPASKSSDKASSTPTASAAG